MAPRGHWELSVTAQLCTALRAGLRHAQDVTHLRAPAHTAGQFRGIAKLTYAFVFASKIYLLNFFVTAVVLACVFFKHNYTSINKI